MVAETIQMPLPNRPEGPPAEVESRQAARQPRVVSSIEFPYSDLETTMQVVNAINSKAGTECEADQLAAWMGMIPTSGSFKSRVSAARMFGLARREGNRVRLTPLGRDTLDSTKAKNARVEAFLTVELYKAIYDRYRGTVLPPTAGLEAEMVALGVSPNQKERARWAFEKSADYAGFFDSGRDRLVSPSVRNSPSSEMATESTSLEPAQSRPMTTAQMREPPISSEHHPFVQGLLKSLPAPDTLWAVEGRAKWLQAAAHIFDLMYKGEGGISISVDAGAGAKRPDQSE